MTPMLKKIIFFLFLLMPPPPNIFLLFLKSNDKTVFIDFNLHFDQGGVQRGGLKKFVQIFTFGSSHLDRLWVTEDPRANGGSQGGQRGIRLYI